MYMQSTVSIIIPVYKAESTLKRCLDSILANKYKSLQVILVEDQSQDQSWNLCQRYAETSGNIVAVRNNTNRGVSYTRNKGLSLAKGQYVLFVDSDDWVEPDYISCLVEAAEKNQVELAVAGYVNHDEIYGGRKDIFCWGDSKEDVVAELNSKLQELYDKRLLQQLWNKIFLRDIIERGKLQFDEHISVGEDFRFVLDYISLMSKHFVVFIERPIYHYIRDNANSLMSRVGQERIEEALINMKKMYRLMGLTEDAIGKKMDEEREKQLQVYAYIIMHNGKMSKSEKKEAIKNLLPKVGKELYRQQHRLYCKERLAKLFRVKQKR